MADAIIKLIGTEKGKRPLRTVVDPITGEYIERPTGLYPNSLEKASGSLAWANY